MNYTKSKVHWEKQKEKWAKQARKKEKLDFYLFSLGSHNFPLFVSLMKTLFSQPFAHFVRNSLLSGLFSCEVQDMM